MTKPNMTTERVLDLIDIYGADVQAWPEAERASAEQLIQGKVAGVQTVQASGEPGAGIAIRIRGTNSIRSNNDPLYVVDGVPLNRKYFLYFFQFLQYIYLLILIPMANKI